jgi:hypothetical protein
MLEYLRTTVRNRKLRLFAVACCRQTWGELTESSRKAAEVAERYADGEASRREMMAARRAVHTEFIALEDGWGGALATGYFAADWNNWEAANCAARSSRGLVRPAAYTRLLRARRRTPAMVEASKQACRENRVADARIQCGFLRCLCNPFRPATLDPAWLTSTVVALARGIYEDRAFDRMPILADALQDAGCDNEDVLSHCRAEKWEHVRGCWVVDLVLGKV